MIFIVASVLYEEATQIAFKVDHHTLHIVQSLYIICDAMANKHIKMVKALHKHTRDDKT